LWSRAWSRFWFRFNHRLRSAVAKRVRDFTRAAGWRGGERCVAMQIRRSDKVAGALWHPEVACAGGRGHDPRCHQDFSHSFADYMSHVSVAQQHSYFVVMNKNQG
jgi:hypothetical protein